MAKRAPARQVSFDSLLDAESPLDPRVVLITDPRWAAGVAELKTARFTGQDCEYYSDSVDVGGIEDGDEDDPAACHIRLIQVALPSSVCLVADLGGVGDDRAAHLKLYGWDGSVDIVTIDNTTVDVPCFEPGSFLDVYREHCESRKTLKIFHHAKGDVLRLRHSFGIRCRGIRCTMLASQTYYAGLQVRHGLGFLSERAVAANAKNVWTVSKKLQKSEWRWHLSNAQINYAATDALVMPGLWKWLSDLLTRDGMQPAALAEMDAVAAFVEMEFHGMPVNPAMLDDHIEAWRRGRELCIKPFTARYPRVSPSKQQHVAVALSNDDCYGGHVFYELDLDKPRRYPVWICGKEFTHSFKARPKFEKYIKETDPSVAEAVLMRFSHLPWISALLDWRSMGVILKWLESVRRRVKRDACVRGEFAQIAGGENRSGDDMLGKGMGRSSLKKPSMQQSANPQPKLDAFVWRAITETNRRGSFTGTGQPRPVATPQFSPRIPFVPHDERAAAYLKWTVARLRGEVPDPWKGAGWLCEEDVPAVAPTVWEGTSNALQLPEEGSLELGAAEAAATDSSANGDDLKWPSSDGDEDDDGDEEVDTGLSDAFRAESLSVAERIAWYEELIAKWTARPRSLLVADFSQAHMRIAAQASQDPQLLEDFQQDRDAHLKLAYDFGVATGQVDGSVPIEEFFAWYDKRHPRHKFVKSLRGPAKTGNYTSLNLGSVERLKQAGETAKPPVKLPREQWEIIRDAWRRRYAVLFKYQRQLVEECNSRDVVIDGEHYGVAWSLKTGRRLWMRKAPDKYDRGRVKLCSGCGKTHGRLTVRGTDAAAMRWMGSESCAIKWAMGHILNEVDSHDTYFMARGLVPTGKVWCVTIIGMAHDEVDATADANNTLAVANCIRRWFRLGLEWAALDDLPAEPRDAKDSDLIVKSWAEK